MIKLSDVLKTIDYIKYQGNKTSVIDSIVEIKSDEIKPTSILWCSDQNINALNNLNHGNVIISRQVNYLNYASTLNFIIVENPRRTFQKILQTFFIKKVKPKISESSIIAQNVSLGKNIFIGENVVIEEGSSLGDNVSIGHNTVIKSDTIIQNDVVIGSNNTIGGVGFGYEKNEDGKFELIPHVGNVIIHKNVEIGNNTCIDRAVLGSTILHENVKVDNLVHIAHGVRVGKNTVVIANSMVAGSVTIGENSWISPSASILNKKTIGDNVLVGMSSLVLKDIENNLIVAGVPAKEIKKHS